MAIAVHELDVVVPETNNIQPSVAKEIDGLAELGFEVHAADVENPQALSDSEQLYADGQIKIMEQVAKTQGSEAGFAIFSNKLFRPAMHVWSRLRMRAMALHTLYGASHLNSLAEGVADDAYDRPIFDGQTAKERLNPEKRDKIVSDYEAYLAEPIDEESRLIFQGCMDARAVNTRAVEAANLAVEYIEAKGKKRDDLVFASLACGAAGPVYQMMDTLEQQGHKTKTIHMVDQDTMALASAFALADKDPELQSKLEIHEKNLFNPDLTEYIEPNSVDVVDLLGLFEYFPSTPEEVQAFMARKGMEMSLEEAAKIDPAADLLKAVSKILKPGGQIIFGNMLNERPQQTFFNEVVQWPPLFQRSITEVLDIIERAGYDLNATQVSVPKTEGVYGVYSITPAERELTVVEDVEALLGAAAAKAAASED